MKARTMYILIAVALLIMLLIIARPSSATAKTILANYANAVTLASYRFGIPQKRIYAIIAQESRGDTQALGASGERGLMQLMRGALTDVNNRFGFNYTFDDMLDAARNILTGTAYLRIKVDEFGGDLDKATQAYNAGASAVKQNPSAGRSYLEKVLRWESQFSSLTTY